ncbi:unnamed protein product [Symbiodinium sp. CCMP2456]|nr:unnamed protein product [Symbiodinium sp. CCMP2456]
MLPKPNFTHITYCVWRLQTTKHSRFCAFATLVGDGSVVSWHSVDSSAVQHQLKNLQQIQASYSASAAILGDGSVVTGGSADHGGDSSAVQDQLRGVQQLQASYSAFGAILGD